MLDCPHPPVMQVTQYFDKVGHHDRSPMYTVARANVSRVAKENTAASHLGPDQYNNEMKHLLSHASSAPSFSFSYAKRIEPGLSLRARMRETGTWIHELGPPYYVPEDVKSNSRIPEQPKYSIPKAQRGDLRRLRVPGPGTYEKTSHFDTVTKQRDDMFAKMVRRHRANYMEWKPEFSNVFKQQRVPPPSNGKKH
jgi:hypothetical protein